MLISCAVAWYCIIIIKHSSSDKRLLRLYLPDNSSKPDLLSLTFFLFIYIFKGLPLLDCVAAQYPDRDHSCNLSILILRSVNHLSSLTLKFQSIARSYLVSGHALNLHFTRQHCRPCMGLLSGSGQSGHVHDRECSCHWVNCVPNLQGVPGSQGDLG